MGGFIASHYDSPSPAVGASVNLGKEREIFRLRLVIEQLQQEVQSLRASEVSSPLSHQTNIFVPAS